MQGLLPVCSHRVNLGSLLPLTDACKEAGLPEPEIKEFQGGFLVTLFKYSFNEEQLAKLGLNERQVKPVGFIGKITNKEYQELFGVSLETASRDLAVLTEIGISENSGSKGAGSFFKLK